MNRQLEGKLEIVTGGASDIGRASVLRFLNTGASVVVADLNEQTGLETLDLARQAGQGDRVRFHRCDVAQETQVESLVVFAASQYGRADCMFNNAGLVGAIGAITDFVDRGTMALGPGVYSGGNETGSLVMEQLLQALGHLDEFREEGRVPPLFESGNVE